MYQKPSFSIISLLWICEHTTNPPLSQFSMDHLFDLDLALTMEMEEHSDHSTKDLVSLSSPVGKIDSAHIEFQRTILFINNNLKFYKT